MSEQMDDVNDTENSQNALPFSHHTTQHHSSYSYTLLRTRRCHKKRQNYASHHGQVERFCVGSRDVTRRKSCLVEGARSGTVDGLTLDLRGIRSGKLIVSRYTDLDTMIKSKFEIFFHVDTLRAFESRQWQA